MNLWNRLLWLPHKEDNEILEEDVEVGDEVNAHVVRRWVIPKKFVSHYMVFLPRPPISLR